MKRKRMSRRRSRRVFTKHARPHLANVRRHPQRGGIRL